MIWNFSVLFCVFSVSREIKMGVNFYCCCFCLLLRNHVAPHPARKLVSFVHFIIVSFDSYITSCHWNDSKKKRTSPGADICWCLGFNFQQKSNYLQQQPTIYLLHCKDLVDEEIILTFCCWPCSAYCSFVSHKFEFQRIVKDFLVFMIFDKRFFLEDVPSLNRTANAH